MNELREARKCLRKAIDKIEDAMEYLGEYGELEIEMLVGEDRDGLAECLDRIDSMIDQAEKED